MSKVQVINIAGEKVKEVALAKEIWGQEVNKSVLRDALVLSNNNVRQGTHATKTRGEISGGGRKPWRQKKTGRARHGSTRSPIWRGGGITFGPAPREYDKKMNRKERRIAIKSALATKAQNKEIMLIDNLNIETPKTKDMVKLLEKIGVNGKTLIIVEELNDNIIMATRNLNNINLIEVSEINPYDIINCQKMLMTEGSLKIIEEVLTK